METKRIFLEGGTWEELIAEITEACKNAILQPVLEPIVKPVPFAIHLLEKVVSNRKAAFDLHMDVRTLNKIIKRNNITRVTASIIELIRQSELK